MDLFLHSVKILLLLRIRIYVMAIMDGHKKLEETINLSVEDFEFVKTLLNSAI